MAKGKGLGGLLGWIGRIGGSDLAEGGRLGDERRCCLFDNE